MTLARVLGAIGRTLITAGVLILLFVAYQLWGTGISQARPQNRLEDEFEAQVDAAEAAKTSTTTSSSTTSTTGGAGSTVATAPPSTAAPTVDALPEGEAMGRIVIPSSASTRSSSRAWPSAT